MNGIPCDGCGWFLGKAHPVIRGERISDVRGDCARCGLDVPAARRGPLNSWWFDWDSWQLEDMHS